jgi:hypothetical protein
LTLGVEDGFLMPIKGAGTLSLLRITVQKRDMKGKIKDAGNP